MAKRMLTDLSLPTLLRMLRATESAAGVESSSAAALRRAIEVKRYQMRIRKEALIHAK